MRLCNAINIQLIFSPQGAFVPLSFDFRLFNRMTLLLFCAVIFHWFSPLCAPNTSRVGFFSRTVSDDGGVAVSLVVHTAADTLENTTR